MARWKKPGIFNFNIQLLRGIPQVDRRFASCGKSRPQFCYTPTPQPLRCSTFSAWHLRRTRITVTIALIRRTRLISVHVKSLCLCRHEINKRNPSHFISENRPTVVQFAGSKDFLACCPDGDRPSPTDAGNLRSTAMQPHSPEVIRHFGTIGPAVVATWADSLSPG